MGIMRRTLHYIHIYSIKLCNGLLKDVQQDKISINAEHQKSYHFHSCLWISRTIESVFGAVYKSSKFVDEKATKKELQRSKKRYENSSLYLFHHNSIVCDYNMNSFALFLPSFFLRSNSVVVVFLKTFLELNMKVRWENGRCCKRVLLNRRQMLLMSALILFTQLERNVRQQFAIIDISMS